MTKTILVAIDYNETSGKAVLITGTQERMKTDILKVFTDESAVNLWNTLTGEDVENK